MKQPEEGYVVAIPPKGYLLVVDSNKLTKQITCDYFETKECLDEYLHKEDLWNDAENHPKGCERCKRKLKK